MTDRIIASLNALKTIMATVTTADGDTPTAVYAYPQDYATMPKPIELDNLPVVIVQRLAGRKRGFGSKANGLDRHVWLAGIDLLLMGYLHNEEQMYQAENLFGPWLEAVKNTLFQNVTLGGTATMIGSGQPNGELFQYIDAHLQWVSKDYWGIRFELPVLHTAAQTMNA